MVHELFTEKTELEISDEEIEELREIIDEYERKTEEYQEELDEIMDTINDHPLYERCGIKLCVDVEHTFSVEENE